MRKRIERGRITAQSRLVGGRRRVRMRSRRGGEGWSKSFQR